MGSLFAITVFLVNGEGVVKAGAQIVNAVLMVIIQFCELLREELDRQELKLERQRHGFFVGRRSEVRGEVL